MHPSNGGFRSCDPKPLVEHVQYVLVLNLMYRLLFLTFLGGIEQASTSNDCVFYQLFVPSFHLMLIRPILM